MTRRMITSEMWEDDFFVSLSIFDRLVWIGLITVCADDQGRLKDSAALIRTRIFPLDDIPIQDVEAALARFCKAGKIERYVDGSKKAIQIISWWKHQTPNWAGKSQLPPMPGWVDRERYHTKGNEIKSLNWDKIGGYIADYIATDIASFLPRDVKGEGEVNGDGDIKGEGEGYKAPDPSPLFDAIAEAVKSKGIPMNCGKDVEDVRELVNLGVTADDVKAGIDWKSANNEGKPIRRVGQLVGPAKTAMLKRLQGNNGHAPPKQEKYTGPVTLPDFIQIPKTDEATT